jgi:hypothetical protein
MSEPCPLDIRYDNVGYFSWTAAQRRPQATALIDLSRTEPIEISYGLLDARLTKRLGLRPGPGFGSGKSS